MNSDRSDLPATILLIDDDVQMLRVLRLGLRRAGYDVQTARDGREGIEQVKKQRPSAIVLDLVMPGMDGLAFLGVLKNHPAVRQIPVIVLTGSDSYESMRKAYNHGTDLFLTKPVDILNVVQAVKQVTSLIPR